MHCFNQFAFWDPGSLLYAESVMEFISQSTEDKLVLLKICIQNIRYLMKHMLFLDKIGVRAQ